ncbi:MAG: hypothetical protein E7402_03065 [Ruminococcaceae bacterium]|nr:hypothetical protein [Oscillospiraceae bacterium]
MGYLSEKAAYLRGYVDGLKISDKNDEGKVIARLLDLVEEMAASIEEVGDLVETCEERIDDLEDFADEMSECCDCDDDCDCDCGCMDDEDEEDVEFYEIECPHCNEKVYFDEDMLDSGDLVCPNCKETIDIEIEE